MSENPRVPIFGIGKPKTGKKTGGHLNCNSASFCLIIAVQKSTQIFFLAFMTYRVHQCSSYFQLRAHMKNIVANGVLIDSMIVLAFDIN